MSTKTLFSGGLALIGSAATFLFGGMDNLFSTVLFFIVSDCVTGVVSALYHEELNSGKMKRGLIRKTYELVIIVVCVRLDKLTGNTFFRTFGCYYFIAMEGLSILENVGKFLELPQFLVKFLEQLKESANNGDSKR